MTPYQETICVIREALVHTFDQLDEIFDLNEQVRTYKPVPDQWSIDEILEHITLTSHFLILVIKNSRDKALKRSKTQPIEDAESNLEAIKRISDPDAFPWVRPEHMEPTGTKPINEVRLTMREQQQECLAALDQLADGQGSLHKVRMSVQNLGKLDIYQWLFFLAQHAQRHLIEIQRIQTQFLKQEGK